MNDGMSGEQLNDLLSRFFSEEDARLLQYFFQNHADTEYFFYENVRLTQEDAQDLLMLGFDQRLLLPEKTRMGPAWEDRILTFDAEAVFQVPPIVRQIAREAGSKEGLQMNFLLPSILVNLSLSEICLLEKPVFSSSSFLDIPSLFCLTTFNTVPLNVFLSLGFLLAAVLVFFGFGSGTLS